MRVIGGEAKGRKLSAPDLKTVRPTSDRVREAIFDILCARGLVEGASVLDLYAGSGALGIEAVSRGASACTFVESDPRAGAAIEANLSSVGFAGREGIRVVCSDAVAFLSRWQAGRVGLGLVDPPYRYSGWDALLAHLPADVAVLEHASSIEAGPRYVTLREYRYGGTLVTLVASTDKDPP